MTSGSNNEIQVYIDTPSVKAQFQLGSLYIDRIKGKEIFTFSFSEEALKNDHIHTLVPNVIVGEGRFHLSNNENNALYKILTDSMPDRWGRALLKKKQLHESKEKGASSNLPGLDDSDYLFQVSDQTRMGAIRFYDPATKIYLGPDNEPIPPVTRVEELQEICRRVENDDEVGEWLKQLIAPGTSLGGARPKANIINQQGNVSIAKFPSQNDEYDVGLWEFICCKLAEQCQIVVSPCEIDKFQSQRTTFMSERFDRKSGNRIHFISAMSLTQHDDGDENASYLEIAEVIKQHGQNPTENLQQLWKRIVFNIAVSNGDDHLRNHGFLLYKDGWELSPAYDMNPLSGTSGYLKLNIDDQDNSADFELALNSCEYFELKADEARDIFTSMHSVISQWDKLAKKYGVSRNEYDMMESAFKVKALKECC